MEVPFLPERGAKGLSEKSCPIERGADDASKTGYSIAPYSAGGQSRQGVGGCVAATAAKRRNRFCYLLKHHV